MDAVNNLFHRLVDRSVHHREQFVKLWRIVGNASAGTLLAFCREPPAETGTADRGDGRKEQQRAVVGEQRRREDQRESTGEYSLQIFN